MISTRFINKTKPIILILFVLPSLVWIGMFINGNLGVNPIDILMDRLGEMSLRLLVLVLIISSLSKFKYLRFLQNIRRLIGLVAFYYVFLHFTCYIFLDHFFNFNFIFKDVVKRPFITFGFLAFILLLPLVFTSTNNMMKKLTFKVWKKIHYLIYPAAILSSVHFYMLVRANKIEPTIYVFLILLLLLYRFYFKIILPRLVR